MQRKKRAKFEDKKENFLLSRILLCRVHICKHEERGNYSAEVESALTEESVAYNKTLISEDNMSEKDNLFEEIRLDF